MIAPFQLTVPGVRGQLQKRLSSFRLRATDGNLKAVFSITVHEMSGALCFDVGIPPRFEALAVVEIGSFPLC
jgi:hypothetical protein